MTWTKRTRRRAPVPADIVGALTELGCQEIRVTGDEAVTHCPYHDDQKLGNFSVNLDTGVNHCFSCGESGQFIRIVQETTAWSYDKAALWCKTRASSTTHLRHTLQDELPPAKVDTSQQMNEAKLALFTDPPEAELAKRHISLEAAHEYGVLWDNGSWVLPIRDPHTNELMGWQRKGPDGVRNYPRGVDKSRTLFGIQSAVSLLILVESPLDCLRLWTAGIKGGVSSFGVAVSDEQLNLLTEKADRVVLALDNDDSGSRISDQLCRTFRRVPLSVYYYGASTAKDPGEQSDTELFSGLANATSAWRTRF